MDCRPISLVSFNFIPYDNKPSFRLLSEYHVLISLENRNRIVDFAFLVFH